MSNYKLIEKKRKELEPKEFYVWYRKYLKYKLRHFRKYMEKFH